MGRLGVTQTCNLYFCITVEYVNNVAWKIDFVSTTVNNKKVAAPKLHTQQTLKNTFFFTLLRCWNYQSTSTCLIWCALFAVPWCPSFLPWRVVPFVRCVCLFLGFWVLSAWFSTSASPVTHPHSSTRGGFSHVGTTSSTLPTRLPTMPSSLPHFLLLSLRTTTGERGRRGLGGPQETQWRAVRGSGS